VWVRYQFYRHVRPTCRGGHAAKNGWRDCRRAQEATKEKEEEILTNSAGKSIVEKARYSRAFLFVSSMLTSVFLYPDGYPRKRAKEMFKVTLSLKDGGHYPTLKEAFKVVYDYVRKRTTEGGLSYQELETTIWVEAPMHTIYQSPLDFYALRDHAHENGWLDNKGNWIEESEIR
jgi:hypothetical protein